MRRSERFCFGLDRRLLDPDPSDREAVGIALCYKLLLLVEKIGQIKRIPSDTETCRLRTDLTADERRRYVAIAASFADAEIWEVGAGRGLTALGEDGPVVPPGPFRDALRAEGLVNCKQDETILALDPNTGVYGQAKDVCGFQLWSIGPAELDTRPLDEALELRPCETTRFVVRESDGYTETHDGTRDEETRRQKTLERNRRAPPSGARGGGRDRCGESHRDRLLRDGTIVLRADSEAAGLVVRMGSNGFESFLLPESRRALRRSSK